ncbi:pilus assembly protein [Arcanobacterium hippocoleae]|uniref:Flp pilus assembly protein TadG n=1 Tax=Arcanobacterium hippocoleae TaxID=149017 RepID=A0ABU1T2G2_9ACTO|nr:pilus assembly protein [Arcanobacterium hippocoleae]MDR6939484.1 Flp pilus assembly protein TadG [Arcanobacterium hippocoleae]
MLNLDQLRKKSESGMVSAEFALTLPVFLGIGLLMMSAVIQSVNIGLVSDGAREAARAYALGKQPQEAIKIAQESAGAEAKVIIEKHGDTASISVTKPGTGIFALIDWDFTAKHSVVLEP